MALTSDPAHPDQIYGEKPQERDSLNGKVEGQNQPEQQNEQEPQLAAQPQPQPQNSQQAEGVVSSSTSPNVTADSLDALARSEKKRDREKQRRSDINRKFSELAETLQSIHNEENKLSRNREDNEEEANLFLSSFKSNQAGLIAHTISMLEKLNNSNKRRKTEIKQVEQKLKEVRKRGEESARRLKGATLPAAPRGGGCMMMMVPVMMSSDGRTPMMKMSQFMQQPFCPVPSQFAPGNTIPPSTTAPTPYSYHAHRSHSSTQIGNTAYSHSAKNTVPASSASLTHVKSSPANQSSGISMMSITPMPTAVAAFPSVNADNVTSRAPHATTSVSTHVVHTPAGSDPSPPAPVTVSSGDEENLAQCA